MQTYSDTISLRTDSDDSLSSTPSLPLPPLPQPEPRVPLGTIDSNFVTILPHGAIAPSTHDVEELNVRIRTFITHSIRAEVRPQKLSQYPPVIKHNFLDDKEYIVDPANHARKCFARVQRAYYLHQGY